MHDKWRRNITGFCVHETAGWPTNMYERKIRQKKTEVTVHFWHMSDGKIGQAAHPSIRMGHAQALSYTTCATEMTTMGPSAGRSKYQKGIPIYNKLGYHFIGRTDMPSLKGKYDIAPYPGCLPSQGKIVMLPTPLQLEAVWRTIVSLKKSPPPVSGKYEWHGGKKHACKFNMHIAFPSVSKSLGVFTWSRWAGRPVGWNEPINVTYSYWTKRGVQGIVSHCCYGKHSDGKLGLYYCFARAKGFSPKDAFYAMVGAATTAKKDGKHAPSYVRYSEFPSKKMIAKGKAKYPFGYKSKFYANMGPKALSWHKKKKGKFGRKLWDEYVAKNPKCIGNLEKPT